MGRSGWGRGVTCAGPNAPPRQRPDLQTHNQRAGELLIGGDRAPFPPRLDLDHGHPPDACPCRQFGLRQAAQGTIDAKRAIHHSAAGRQRPPDQFIFPAGQCRLPAVNPRKSARSSAAASRRSYSAWGAVTISFILGSAVVDSALEPSVPCGKPGGIVADDNAPIAGICPTTVQSPASATPLPFPPVFL